MHGHVYQRPRSSAGAPRARVVRTGQADLGCGRPGRTEVEPCGGGGRSGDADQLAFLATEARVQGLFLGGEPEPVVHQTLQVDSARAHPRGEWDEPRNFFEIVLHHREPERDAGMRHPSLFLQRTQALKVRHDLVKGIGAPDAGVRRRGASVERHAQLVEARGNQGVGACHRQTDRIGVEEDGGATRVKVSDHPRQIAVEERLTDAVQEDALQRGELIDDVAKPYPRQVLGRLATAERQDARLTFGVAAARGLDVQRPR